MGISNLSSFVDEVGLRKPYRLSNTYVVIDGHNLCHALYSKLCEDNPSDHLFGGTYTEYTKLFKQFFTNLKQCDITPIVVFDGGANPNLTDQMKKFEQKLNLSKQLSDNPPELPLKRVTTNSVKYPNLITKLFKSVADMMEIHCITTESDADLEMAKLAIHMDCPLMSNDSDFLVMNIKRGIITIDSLKWQNTSQKEQNYIECQVFKIDGLLEFKSWNPFESRLNQIVLKSEMLPIFGSLFRNDGIGEQFDGLFGKISDQTKGLSLRTNRYKKLQKSVKHKRWRRMDQFLCWLAIRCHNNVNEVILYIEIYCLRNQRILEQFRESLKSYDTNGKSYLKELVDHKMMATNDDQIPIEEEVIESEISKSEQNVCFKRPLIEDFSQESTYESSIRLKRFYMGLKRTNRMDDRTVRMILRKGHSFEEIVIRPETHFGGKDGKEVPVLSELQNLCDIEKKSILFDILEFNEKWMTELEEELISVEVNEEDIEFWKYFLIVIKYWNSNSKINEFKTEFIESFVQSIIYFRHNSLITNDFIGMTSVNYCSGQQFKPFVIHYYCEIQAIYYSIDGLVSLLGDPIPGPKLLHYLNGILLYNLFHEIKEIKTKDLNPFNENRLNKISNIIINSILNP